MTQKFHPAPYVARAGKRLVTLEDFQNLPPGSVLVDVGPPDGADSYGEVYQKHNNTYWNLPGDDLMSLPYSDQEFAGFADKNDHLYYLVWETKPERSQ